MANRITPTLAGVLGGVIAAATFMWLCAVAVTNMIDSPNGPVAIYMLIVAGASTSTLSAVIIGVFCLARKTNAAANTAVLDAISRNAEDIGGLAAQMEQISQKMTKIDPMQIYAAVAEDFLVGEKRQQR